VADNMFAGPLADIGGKRKYTVLVSIVTHTLILAAAIIVPLAATDTLVLPSRFITITLQDQPPLPPSPPPPPQRDAIEPPPLARDAAPINAPPAIVPETPIQATADPFAGFDSGAGIVQGSDFSAPPPPPSPSPVVAEVPVPVGGNIKRPLKVGDVAPAYPALARAARVEGLVIIEATIGRDGRVRDARVIRSIPLLDAAALDAVRQWAFTPTLLNGSPVAIVMTVTVDFRLR